MVRAAVVGEPISCGFADIPRSAGYTSIFSGKGEVELVATQRKLSVSDYASLNQRAGKFFRMSREGDLLPSAGQRGCGSYLGLEWAPASVSQSLQRGAVIFMIMPCRDGGFLGFPDDGWGGL